MTKRKDLCSGAAANRTALNLSRQRKCIKIKRLEGLRALNQPLNKSDIAMIYEDGRRKKQQRISQRDVNLQP